MKDYLFTSESVTEGHPDKVADKISDTILDAYLKEDPHARVACETLVTTDLVVLAGEIGSRVSQVNHEELVRNCIREIGYVGDDNGFNGNTCKIVNQLHEQSSDIAQGVDRGDSIGAGDQGLMFGYACNETTEKMPLCISLAHKLTENLSRLRKSGELAWLKPDGKAQVTVQYNSNGQPEKIHTVVLSTQHAEDITQEELKTQIIEKLVRPTLPEELLKEEPRYHINPTGNFVIGGPHGDAGLTGRKIIVDTYGGYAPHGGGAFSGKDATKVDRSAAYMARYISKNIVAAGLADRFQLQLAYAIGVEEPVSLHIESFGTARFAEEKIQRAIQEIFPMTPAKIIETLELRKATFSQSTNYGHFGREDSALSWEKTDRVSDLKSFFKL